MNNSMKKYVEITGKTGSDKIYPLLDEVKSDLDEDVDNKMNDSDEKFFGNDEGDYNSGSVANARDILVPAANVHSSSSGSSSFNCSARFKKSQLPGVGKATTRYYYIFLVIEGRLMSLRKTLT